MVEFANAESRIMRANWTHKRLWDRRQEAVVREKLGVCRESVV